MLPLKYLSAYPETLQDKVRKLIADDKLGMYLADRYPHRHAVQSDRALYEYTTDLKQEFLRVAPAIDKVMYDAKLDVLRHALGLHTAISRVQGGQAEGEEGDPRGVALQGNAAGIPAHDRRA